MSNVKRAEKIFRAKGQMTIEYTVMFVMIVAVILLASKQVIQPALNRWFNSTARVINSSAAQIENQYSNGG